MATNQLPQVMSCTVADCSYNHAEACAAAAITMGKQKDAACVTFIPLGVKGGLDRVQAYVGACQQGDCLHNSALECTAPAVRVGAGSAECLTFATR